MSRRSGWKGSEVTMATLRSSAWKRDLRKALLLTTTFQLSGLYWASNLGTKFRQ